MERLPFGTRVRVTHVVVPKYLSWVEKGDVVTFLNLDDELETPDNPEDFVLRDNLNDEPIGEALPESAPVPHGGVHRRLRRYEYDNEGVIVGWVWRAEGQYHAGTGRPIHPDDDYGHPYLAETGRIKLYQVALDPGEIGQRFHPARMVYVKSGDLSIA